MAYFRLIVLSIFAGMAVNSPLGQTQQTNESPRLVESRELTSKVVKLYGERKYDEALPLAKRALELGEAEFGQTDPRLIGLLINLGDLYTATIHFDDARISFERALSISEKAFGPNDLRLTRPLDDLGYLMSNKGELKNAADLFSRSLALKEKHLQPGDIEIARGARILGDIYRRTREYAKAEQLYERAIRLYEATGKKDPELVEALNRYLVVLTA